MLEGDGRLGEGDADRQLGADRDSIVAPRPAAGSTRSTPSNFEGISRAAVILVGAGLVGRALTLITQIAIADRFGASPVADAYFATEAISELLLDVVVGGFVMAFIPGYAHVRMRQREREAGEFTGAFIVIASGFSALLAVIMVVGAPLIARLIAPGFDDATRAITVSLIRIMAAAVALIGINAGLRGLLQAHRSFLAPELGRLAYAASLLVAATSVGWVFGVQTLAWGMVIGAVLIAIIQAVQAARLGLLPVPLSVGHPEARRAARRIPPIFVAIAWTGVLLAIDRMVASQLDEGSVATLNYAARIVLLPIGLLALPLKTAFFPAVADLASRRRYDEIASGIQTGLRVLLFLVIPACVGLAVLNQPVTRLLFERGAFDPATTAATGEVLVIYALAVPAMSIIAFVNGYYFAASDLRPLLMLNMVGWGLNLGASAIAAQSMGVSGVALGTAIASTVTAALMIHDLRRRHLPALDLTRIGATAATALGAAAVMGITMWAAEGAVSELFSGPGTAAQAATVLGTAALGLAVYFVGYLGVASIVGGDETAVLKSVTSRLRPSAEPTPDPDDSGAPRSSDLSSTEETR